MSELPCTNCEVVHKTTAPSSLSYVVTNRGLFIGHNLHDSYANHYHLYYSGANELSCNSHGQYHHLYYRVHYSGDNLDDFSRLPRHVSSDLVTFSPQQVLASTASLLQQCCASLVTL